ncbi:hypothetical protein CNMCM5793_009090 [Aspergillus hiratsukae]|uniref:Glucose-methanol-choline oxidoreductase N-terminal domain-containing protein n=1 Tax=Aspergillus hiratsukae TaxID=1194566 RepID=A0A8H6UFA6_9EURO|nr:hypothetical protein CNMCM5793_009090 [Aspergillus hiratsukae]
MSAVADEITAKPYDYIIVGGGTAGLTLAARLSENPDVTVAVLEAGEAHLNDPRVMTPGLAVSLYDDPKYDWGFKTVPQKHSLDHVFAWPRGKGLGGCSMLNFGVMTYPSKREIDNWGPLGNPGWSWDELFPYFLKSETYHPPAEGTTAALNSAYVQRDAHGHDGPIQTCFAQASGPFDEVWQPTMEKLGCKLSGDPKKGVGMGAYTHMHSVDPTSRTRSYAVTAYYLGNAERKNLSVLTGAISTMIIFEEEDTILKAVGVEFTHNGTSYVVSANREVVLCGGSLGSPQLLELSGIGSRSVLESIGVEVLVENDNVGENLQDHIGAAHMFEVEDPVLLGPDLRDPSNFQAAMEEYQTSRTGPLSKGGISNLAYLSCADYLPSDERNGLRTRIERALEQTPPQKPGLEKQYQILTDLLLNPEEAGGQTRLVPRQVDVSETAYPVQNMSSTFMGRHPGAFITLLSSITRPFSRGSIHATSKDPTVAPTIDPNVLSHPLDIELLSKHVTFMEKVGQTEPLASLLKDKGRVYYPGLEDKPAEYRAKRYNSLEWHPCGTCSMLPREQGGVVDPNLRVYGTKNVRVVDASIFPLIPRGNPQSLVYAVAEKAADMIKAAC